MEALRQHLVEYLLASGALHDARVTTAMHSVPRHLFLPDVDLERAYRDEPVPTKWGPDGRPISSASQPAIVALMLEQLAVEPGHRVLEIGAGTGYNAALLASLVGTTGSVTTVDLDVDLVEQAGRNLRAAGIEAVTVVCADGAAGEPAGAPYDRIILTVAAADLAPAWTEQLATDGRLVLPLTLRGVDRSVAFVAAPDHLVSDSVIPCGFMPLRGRLAARDPVRVLGPGLELHYPGSDVIDQSALRAALDAPGNTVSTGVRVTAPAAVGGLVLWVALTEPRGGQLVASGPALAAGVVSPLVSYAGMASTVVLLGDDSLAALTRPDTAGAPDFEVGIRPYGPTGAELAGRLAAGVRAWHAAGRPGTDGLRIRAYPRTAEISGDRRADSSGDIVLDTRFRRFVLDWQQPTVTRR